MRLFGLIGSPLTHSFSKKYFTDKFLREQIPDCSYELFPIPSIDALGPLLESEAGLEGLNVTIPYKQAVIPWLHQASDVVKKTGACNCIRLRRGRLEGFNTDVTGFRNSLLDAWQPRFNRALVLGTGGASRAVTFVLDQLGIPFQLVSRAGSPEAITYAMLTPDIIRSHPLIINTTPLGTFPAVEEAPPIPYEAIGPEHYLFDLVYNPARTLFLERGEMRGATIRNGADMLRIQAEESWIIWNS